MKNIFSNLLESRQINLEFQKKPKKFKKYHKIKYKIIFSGVSSKVGGENIVFLKHTALNPNQILSVLKLLKPAMKKCSRSRALIPIMGLGNILTAKPKDVRMGRGKGLPTEFRCVKKSGSLVAALYMLSAFEARNLKKSCSLKLANANKIENYK